MDQNKRKLTNSFCKLNSDAMKAGLAHEEVENVLLSLCSESAREHRRRARSDPQSSGESSGTKRAELNSSISFCYSPHVFISSLLCIVSAVLYLTLYGQLQQVSTFIKQSPCLWEANILLMEISRPIESCRFCEGITSFPTYQDISQDEFLEKHAYTSRPALILEGGTRNWTASKSFSFKFFQSLYKDNENALTAQEECQFFPYNTEFGSFEEFLNMSDDRADLKENPWYVGWSNCDRVASTEIRRHYSMPHFLPEGAESSSTDWIFMGGPGLGANVHIDSVNRPSWQAQIRGYKTWTLIPPPECEHVCHKISATMVRGNVIIVDTNKWYHKTDIHPGDISITIGSEYD